MENLKISEYRLRKAIGILGLALPVLLLLGHDHLLSSMSHYYYTPSSVFFIGILVAFGLVLFTYRGYPIDKTKREVLSADTVTTIAAICIFVTVLVPTNWEGALGPIHFENNSNYLFGHSNQIKGTIHLISAGLFLALLGYMCFAKFTLGTKIPVTRKMFYKACAIVIWSSIGLLIILFAVDLIFLDDNLNLYFPAYVFWFELFAVWSFGIAWLVKGKFNRDFQDMYNKITLQNNSKKQDSK